MVRLLELAIGLFSRRWYVHVLLWLAMVLHLRWIKDLHCKLCSRSFGWGHGALMVLGGLYVIQILNLYSTSRTKVAYNR
jgi:hypothetical protein